MIVEVRSLCRAAGLVVPEHRACDLVIMASGHVSRRQLARSARRESLPCAVDPDVLLAGLAAWGVTISRHEALRCAALARGELTGASS